MEKPTQEQIDSEIAALRELRDKIPPRSAFGDDNIAKIDAEIMVLSKNMNGDWIDRKYGSYEGAYESAGYAREWLDGTALDGSMSDGWRVLVGVEPRKL